jgi:hypothetical protein
VSRAAALVALEGGGLVLGGVAYGVAGLVGDPFDRTATLLQAAFALVVGVLVLLVARGLHRTSGWSRSPVVLLQLLALPVGVGLAQSGIWYAAVPVLLLAAAVLYLLATPEARLAFEARG